MDFSPSALALIGVITFFAAVIGGMGGFGTGIILTAVLTPILGIKAVVPVLAISGIIINSGRFWFYRRDFDLRAVKTIAPCALVFLFIGASLYKEMNAAHLSMAIGVIVLASIPARRALARRNVKLGTRGLLFSGSLFGFLSGLASGMGVVLVSTLLGAGLSGTAVLATDALITISVDITRSILFSRFDLLSLQGVALGVGIGFCSLPGSWLASILVGRLGKKLHIVAIETLIAAGGASLLYQGSLIL